MKSLKRWVKQQEIDSGRSLSPLRAARDACVIDTTGLSVDEVVDQIIELVENLKQNDCGDG
ncbi:(d)CMP kinase [Acetomicrobium sp. S15 = DSM 107314]|uniref:(d)CMP kinase n=1 Tax=Acetomicrobium sp. S15 = DSM 107314 TaxID=2529858 RepID=UPI0018E11139